MYPSDDGSDYKSASPRLQPPTPPLVSTPPLVFTPRYVSSQITQDLNGISPYVEPLQLPNYSSMVGMTNTSGRRNSGAANSGVSVSPIKVICRTHSGRQPPFMAACSVDPLLEPGGEPLPGGMKNPYGLTYSGRSTPLGSSPSQSLSAYPNPLHQSHNSSTSRLAEPQVSALDPAYELPAGVVHRGLVGHCRFIPFPTSLPATKATGPRAVSSEVGGAESIAVFIGQVRFETTPAELVWLVHRTSGALATHLESRGAGCYLLHCNCENDLQVVRALHKRILFDIGGVWIARTAEEIDSLCEYVAIDAPLLARKARLPRDSMVVEDLKLDNPAGSTRHGGAGIGAGSGGHGKHHPGTRPSAHNQHQQQQRHHHYHPQNHQAPPSGSIEQPRRQNSDPPSFNSHYTASRPPPYSERKTIGL